MKNIINLLILVLLVSCSNNKFITGDIVFQDSQSNQSKAIKLATHSEVTHCGLIIEKNGKLLVLEAVQPVKFTPLQEWIEIGKDNHYAVMRLKDSSKITTANFAAEKMR